MAAVHEKQPHFVLFPFMAQGHMIPMEDTARLLGKRGVIVTILVTLHNYNRIKPMIDRAVTSGSIINISQLKFPSAEAGLPQGCENLDTISSTDELVKFFKATAMLEDQVQQILQNLQPYPSCLISDVCFPWTTNVSVKLGIPRIVFYGTSCFCMLCMHMRWVSKDFEAVDSADTEYFVVPDLPDRIEITKAQIRGRAKQVPYELVKILERMWDADVEALGIVANTFEELEPQYVRKYVELKGETTKVWCIGPVSLCNEDVLDKAQRGDKASIDENECLKWLDLQKTGSVIYVCHGSLSCIGTSQLIELGLGLEASDRPFVWVIRNASDNLKTWLMEKEEKFEEILRIRGRGLMIYGWAPQVLILSHPSVGGFLTHCGWNSTMEGITSCLPMLTWPVFADQFCNEKFIVNVIKTGVRVGVEVPVSLGEEDTIGVQVKSDDIKTAIDRLMDGGDEEGEERRERARKLGKMSKSAADQEGGSSYLNLTRLIQDVVMQN